VERGQPERLHLAEELLEKAVQHDKRSYLSHLYLARLIIGKQGGDLERAEWLLKQASRLDERATMPLLERARICTGRQQWKDAHDLIDKVLRMEPGNNEARGIRGELYEAQGLIFNADQEYGLAIERSPQGSKVRARYEEARARTQQLITSGAAIELQKRAEEAGNTPVAIPQPRANPASRSIRRRKGGNAPAPAVEVATEASDIDPAESAEVTESTDAMDGDVAELPAEEIENDNETAGG